MAVRKSGWCLTGHEGVHEVVVDVAVEGLVEGPDGDVKQELEGINYHARYEESDTQEQVQGIPPANLGKVLQFPHLS